MILTSALCLDNGFRIVVVVTANNVALVKQTENRFKALDGPRVFSTVADDVYEWEGREDQLRQDIGTDGLVLVCAKDAFHLPQVIQFLQRMEAFSYPAIVFDDEADAATPDTTLAARTSGRANAPTYASTINRRIIENPRPGEEGESVSEILPHSFYVQATATPFLLFLQRQNARIRPTLTFLLEPGGGYCGGERFFANFDPAIPAPAPPIVLVPDNEAQTIPRPRVPMGLAASIEFFLVVSAARAREAGWPAEGFKHLSHTSPRIAQHHTVAGHIERHVDELRRRLRDHPEEGPQIFAAAHAELRRTLPGARPLAELVALIAEAMRQVEVIRVNAETDVPTYGPRLNFLVGGNILGRGLTIDDLLVTYYVREAQTAQMDTVWQHARMYGYREPLMPYTRVYLPRRLASRFKEIHESEEQLRELLRLDAAGEEVPIRVAARSRPTRPNATEPTILRVYRGDLAQIHPLFVQQDPGAASQILQRLTELNVPINQGARDQRTVRVRVDALLDLVELVPIRDGDDGKWDSGAVAAVIESYRRQYGDQGGPVYVRGLQAEDAPPEGWTRGRLSGPEVDMIRAAAPGVPGLALLYVGRPDRPNGWYPTLVRPPNSGTFIINPA